MGFGTVLGGRPTKIYVRKRYFPVYRISGLHSREDTDSLQRTPNPTAKDGSYHFPSADEPPQTLDGCSSAGFTVVEIRESGGPARRRMYLNRRRFLKTNDRNKNVKSKTTGPYGYETRSFFFVEIIAPGRFPQRPGPGPVQRGVVQIARTPGPRFRRQWRNNVRRRDARCVYTRTRRYY